MLPAPTCPVKGCIPDMSGPALSPADREALSACASTCEAWLPPSRLHLLRTIALSGQSQLIRVIHLPRAHPHMGALVGRLTVHGGPVLDNAEWGPAACCSVRRYALDSATAPWVPWPWGGAAPCALGTRRRLRALAV